MLIGDVAKRSGVSARMLRHYESLGLVEPDERSPGGYREYSAGDIGRIFHIEGLRKLGLSLAEVKSLLADPDFDPARLIGDLIESSKQKIAAETRLLHHLQQMNRLHHADGESLLLTIDLMRSLESGDAIQRHKAALGSGVDGGVPVESLSAAVLNESVLNAAGAMRWALAQSGPEAVNHLAKGMDDLSVDIRRNAIRALDEIRRNGSGAGLDATAEAVIVDALHSGLGDTDPEVRTTAALILGQMGDPMSVPDLLEMAIDGPKDIEAAEALAAFVISSPSKVSSQIMSDLRRHARSPEAVVRFRVLQVLMEIPGEAIDDFIAQLGADESFEVAATATAALNRRRAHRLGEQENDSPPSGV